MTAVQQWWYSSNSRKGNAEGGPIHVPDPAFYWGGEGTHADWQVTGNSALLDTQNVATTSKLLFATRTSAATGKRYFEFGIHDLSSAATYSYLGFLDSMGNSFDMNQSGFDVEYNREHVPFVSGMFGHSNIPWGSSSSTMRVAIDFDAGKVWFGDAAVYGNGGFDPGDGGDCEAHPMYSADYGGAPIGGIIPYMDNTFGIPNTTIVLRTSADQFLFTPPTGYSALRT